MLNWGSSAPNSGYLGLTKRLDFWKECLFGGARYSTDSTERAAINPAWPSILHPKPKPFKP